MSDEVESRKAALVAAGQEAEREHKALQTPEQVEAWRVKHLGQSSALMAAQKAIGKLPADQRKAFGEFVNGWRKTLDGLLDAAHAQAQRAALDAELQETPIDVTLPGRHRRPGHRHPVSRTLEDIVRTFARLGFEVATGPEIELDRYNFEALNIPADHPARDMQDTFYVDASWLKSDPNAPALLRTHTSPVQIRTLLREKPPVRIVAPGKVYRVDSDVTHTPMFHQVEGLLVDQHVTFAELKGTLAAFAAAFFGSETKTRFRASFFPFTEPSAEVDISCLVCGGKGCRVCKQTGWLEILGCGMVHPNVFTTVGYDPNEVTGFAFGMGVERIAMLRHRIDDLRLMFENDVRFLEQF
jgi:phenylalanyl-tRNA synthetase alpha chain